MTITNVKIVMIMMTSKNKIFYNLLAGALGGIAGWAIGEFIVPLNFGTIYFKDLAFGAVIGFFMGSFIGAIEGIMVLSKRQALLGAISGAGICVIGGAIGLIIGEVAFQILKGGIIARAIGWGFLGVSVGVGSALPSQSMRKIINGIIGGAIGGFIGGAIFDLINSGVQIGMCGRLIALIVLGASIGIFIALVEELLKESWLKVIKGRFEGKEYILYKPVTILGRDEKSDIGLFGDPSISGRHAEIRIEDKKYLLSNISSASGTFVNEVAITRHTLKDGDRIQIGNILLLYREKVRKSKEGPPTLVTSKPSVVEVPRKEAVSDRTAVKIQEGKVRRGYLLAQGIISAIGKVPLAKEVTTLGRDKTNDIVIDQDSISRRHAQIKKEGNQYIIYDLNSTNGTFIDGVKVIHSIIRDGQVIKLGECEFIFKEE